MRRSGRPQTGGSGDESGLSFILTPGDEAQFWADEANTNKKRDKREMASGFYSVLEPIAAEFAKIETLQLQGMSFKKREFLERVSKNLVQFVIC